MCAIQKYINQFTTVLMFYLLHIYFNFTSHDTQHTQIYIFTYIYKCMSKDVGHYGLLYILQPATVAAD